MAELTQEWIDKNTVLVQYVTKEGLDVDRFVKVSKLHDLIVPDPENSDDYIISRKPVIPHYVAEYIREARSQGVSLGEVLTIDSHHFWDIKDYLIINESVFVRAWLFGFTLEEDPHYRIKAGNNYVIFKKDGSIQTVRKENATISRIELNNLPFNIGKAVASGIIVVEEVTV